jgi:hypothetical protein
MKNEKRLTLALLITAAMPLTLSSVSLAEPDHKDAHAMATQSPTMDAEAKKVWDRSIEAAMSDHAEDEWVKSMRLVGTMSMPSQGISAEMNILIATGKGMRLNIAIPGLGSFEQGISGDVAWSSSMMEGPKILDGDEATQLLKELDLYADLHWDQYYSTITYKGEETITLPDDTEVQTNVLELTDIEDGSVSTQYYDAKTGLLALAESSASMNGATIPTTAYTMDYHDVEGIMIPFKTISNSGPIQQVIEFTTVEVNGEIADGELDLPDDIKELLED